MTNVWPETEKLLLILLYVNFYVTCDFTLQGSGLTATEDDAVCFIMTDIQGFLLINTNSLYYENTSMKKKRFQSAHT